MMELITRTKLMIQLLVLFVISERGSNLMVGTDAGEIRRAYISPYDTINKVSLTQKGYIQVSPKCSIIIYPHSSSTSNCTLLILPFFVSITNCFVFCYRFKFLKYLADVPPLTEFTFCLWMRSDNLNFSHPLFSYSSEYPS